MGRRRVAWVLAVAGSALVAACGSAGSGGPPTPVPTGSAGQLYVSVGDSYAAGYQPTAPRAGATTRNGFAYQTVGVAAAKGYDLRLANFGCSGATTTSVLTSPGCLPAGLGPGAASYGGRTQAAAAQAYLRAHRGRVALITVSIGGNDVTRCAIEADPTSCLVAALKTVRANVATIAGGLRAAAGPDVPIIGTTYPDVLLAGYLKASTRSSAALSVTAFKALINPTLTAAYATASASFVDVTAATGAYTPFSDTTTLAPYGTLPVAVAKVCELTYSCEFGDIHPRTAGYRIIADLVVAALPRRPS